MRNVVPPRLRKPLWSFLAGVAFGAALLVHGGPLAWVSILALIGGAARAVSLYRLGAQDNDEGALAGSRADERQTTLSLKSRALGWNLTTLAAFIGLTVAIALKAVWWWPFLVILAVAGFGYLLGLSNYGVAEEDPAEDDSSPQQARSPIS